MEEEYRAQKAQVEATSPRTANGPDPSKGKRVIHEDGSVTTSGSTKVGSSEAGESMADDNASTMGVRSAAGTPAPLAGADADADVDAIANGLPTIRISTESNRERVKKEAEVNGNGTVSVADEEDEEDEEAEEEKPETVNKPKLEKLEKPTTAELANGESSPNPSQEAFSFSNKRLCERWLDNLFMVLYEVRGFLDYRCD